MTRWPAAVTKWHRPPGAGPIFAEVGADVAGLAASAASQAALWWCALPWLTGREPSAFLNAAFCVHAITLLGTWVWMRRFYPPPPGLEGRGSQARGALWYLAEIGLLLGTFHLADFGPLSGTFSPENRVAVAVAGAFVLGALLTYYVELSWQPVARPVTADAPAVP